MRHHLTHAEEVKGGHHSHKAKADHHHKHASHHHKEMHKHLKELHKMAKKAHGTEHHQKAHHTTAHDRAVDRKNLMHARAAKKHR